ncbi:hypothetical protein HYC85_027702 [Camellia sinensis]|uniref:Leucine-rich repeat-containing N-terminal plant-type domain-containing protein n=1 Tax=Camellia sinensis TaxID=4442 RepID=A0A7J7FU40_CAMSI|nr:hypothetical protein HYC85_027702 [Camellia sinensis]
MDISYNSFSGSIIPSCSNRNLQYLEHMHLQGNKFTGLISRALLNSSHLLTLDIRDNIFFCSIPDSIRLLSNLRILLFRGNQLSGSIPIQLCQLHQINLMDLSNNYLNGSIPPRFIMYDEVDKIEFVTKSRSNSYKGNILNFMSGLDLSHNKLIGEIPFELGKLSSIHALNLSHNLLTGPIPKTFSNLAQIESLKLSYNSLSGNISTKLINLNFLEVFTVAHNNLSDTPFLTDLKTQTSSIERSVITHVVLVLSRAIRLLGHHASRCVIGGMRIEDYTPWSLCNDGESANRKPAAKIGQQPSGALYSVLGPVANRGKSGHRNQNRDIESEL